jgi:signal transduction histidine kinase
LPAPGGEPPLSDDKKKYLGLAQTEVERLITLVQRTLEFYRPSQGRTTATDVNRLIENVLALANKRLEHGQVRVHTQLQAELAPITAVPDQLTQVLLNLIINAVEAMSNGGTLRPLCRRRATTGWRLRCRTPGRASLPMKPPGFSSRSIPPKPTALDWVWR